MKTLKSNLSNNKELMKNINSLKYYSIDQFVNDANRYINAIKENRMLCIISSVSKSGMSRKLSFKSCEKNTPSERYSYTQYICLFKALGYKEYQNSGTFQINGCGMDMVFHTNYSIIHNLHKLELIDKKDCDTLCQCTPVCF